MRLITILALFIFCGKSYAQDNEFFDSLDAFLSEYMNEGQLNYQEIKQNQEELNACYQMVADMNLDNKDDAFKKAFYINAYNILVLKQVVVFYPINSPFDVNGFFDNIKHEVAKDEMTLDELEKEIILPTYKDPRIHFALVCAARGCPPLSSKAYRPETLDRQLDAKSIEMINSDNFVAPGIERVVVSKIFEWYKSDFLQDDGSVLEFINKYRNDKIPVDHKVTFTEYDWTLNDFRN